jgi:sortase (surface protein transpeptidase)
MRGKLFLVAVTMLCLVAAAGSFTMAWRSTDPQRHLIAFHPVHESTAPARSPTRTHPTAPWSAAAPVSVAIPAIGLSARVVPVGLDLTGQLEIPGPSLAGWYQLGPAPGAQGAAVIVGHVDNYLGPAVFYRLTGIRPGDQVHIVRADGTRATFVISKVTTLKKTAFPTKEVFAPTTTATIRLITCTGPFNTSVRSYVDSLIAWGYATAS